VVQKYREHWLTIQCRKLLLHWPDRRSHFFDRWCLRGYRRFCWLVETGLFALTSASIDLFDGRRFNRAAPDAPRDVKRQQHQLRGNLQARPSRRWPPGNDGVGNDEPINLRYRFQPKWRRRMTESSRRHPRVFTVVVSVLCARSGASDAAFTQGACITGVLAVKATNSLCARR